MKVSGFTFLRNAVNNGYPFEESIRSLLPLVDEYVVAIGSGVDDTRDRVIAINDPKIRIIDTVWNEQMSDRGFVYGQQKMIAQYNCTGDWAFYLEGDEVLHENELEQIRASMRHHLHDLRVEALYFDFFHFYGDASTLGVSGYRQAPRIIRNSIRSFAPDGLFFVVLERNKKGRYPFAASANANIYHYGHARKVEYTRAKLEEVGKYWGRTQTKFRGYDDIDLYALKPFKGTHPAVMGSWLSAHAETDFKPSLGRRPSARDLRNRFRFWFENLCGVEISKKHFKAIDE
jgi:hypothetical protein